MEGLFLFLLCAVVLLLAFLADVFVGITDCKRRFFIPRHATGVNTDGYTYD